MGLFNFKKESKREEAMLNGVIFICNHLATGKEPFSYVCHKNNGDYECFCSACAQELDLNSVIVCGRDEIIKESNRDFFDIEKGKYIFLQDDNWYERKINMEDEYTVWSFDLEEKIINENIRINKELRSDLSGMKIKRDKNDVDSN